jgi:hypothetical protein
MMVMVIAMMMVVVIVAVMIMVVMMVVTVIVRLVGHQVLHLPAFTTARRRRSILTGARSAPSYPRQPARNS